MARADGPQESGSMQPNSDSDSDSDSDSGLVSLETAGFLACWVAMCISSGLAASTSGSRQSASSNE
eukprot:3021412-Rhodomonas_salina.1